MQTEQQIIAQRRSEHFEYAGSEATRFLAGTLPNGLAFARNGDILISNFGTDCLEIMSRDGASRIQVKLGRSSVNNIEVLSGLKVGETVVLSDMSAWDAFDRVRLK